MSDVHGVRCEVVLEIPAAVAWVAGLGPACSKEITSSGSLPDQLAVPQPCSCCKCKCLARYLRYLGTSKPTASVLSVRLSHNHLNPLASACSSRLCKGGGAPCGLSNLLAAKKKLDLRRRLLRTTFFLVQHFCRTLSKAPRILAFAGFTYSALTSCIEQSCRWVREHHQQPAR